MHILLPLGGGFAWLVFSYGWVGLMAGALLILVLLAFS